MRLLLIAAALLTTSFTPAGPHCHYCTPKGKGLCTACTNCKYCGHCNSGGKCSVCKP